MRSWLTMATLALAALLLTPSAHAKGSNCARIADPSARLACYDRGTGSRTSQAEGSCTRSNPCVGPRGGIYYFTATGNKRYLPRR